MAWTEVGPKQSEMGRYLSGKIELIGHDMGLDMGEERVEEEKGARNGF